MDGLNISVASTPEATDSSSKPKSKGKSKAKAEARELIVDTHLRLKPGVHYGFIGRNGTGKSSEDPTILFVLAMYHVTY